MTEQTKPYAISATEMMVEVAERKVERNQRTMAKCTSTHEIAMRMWDHIADEAELHVYLALEDNPAEGNQLIRRYLFGQGYHTDPFQQAEAEARSWGAQRAMESLPGVVDPAAVLYGKASS